MGTTRKVDGAEERNGGGLDEVLLETMRAALGGTGAGGAGDAGGAGGGTGGTESAGGIFAGALQGLASGMQQGAKKVQSALESGGIKPSALSGSVGATGGGGGGGGSAAAEEEEYNPISRSAVLAQYESNLGEKPERTESERTATAYERMMGYDGTRPGPYESGYRAQMDEILGQLAGREGFSYNPEEDQLYRSYRDQYLRLGNRAMQDTMAQAAGLTGGYGSSYAQGVGQQAYQDYLSKLNEQLPNMYQLAYDRYKDEGDDLYNRLNALYTMDTTDYSRYRDRVGDWETDRTWWTGRYDTESGQDMERYAQDLAAWQADRDYWKSMLSLMEDDRNLKGKGGSGGGGGGGGGGGKSGNSGGGGSEESNPRSTLEQLAAALNSGSGNTEGKEKTNDVTGDTETVTLPVDTWTGADPGVAGLTGVNTTNIGLLNEIARRYGVSPSRLGPVGQ